MMMETERLLLRHFIKNDAKEAHELFSDEEAMRMDGMYPLFTHFEETKERIDHWVNSEKHLAIVLKETGELLGYVVINPDSEEGREDTRELGFALISKYRGNGYMKEAINAVLKELSKRNIVYVWACCFKENIPSERLIRSIGFEFQQEGTFNSPNDREYESLEFRMKL
ncbi:MAG: GNAT family N-acetyltransferase [Clostridiales bacterium]|nr:GNAT family N-acetyltransferase [Clostridiales bacterium]